MVEAPRPPCGDKRRARDRDGERSDEARALAHHFAPANTRPALWGEAEARCRATRMARRSTRCSAGAQGRRPASPTRAQHRNLPKLPPAPNSAPRCVPVVNGLAPDRSPSRDFGIWPSTRQAGRTGQNGWSDTMPRRGMACRGARPKESAGLRPLAHTFRKSVGRTGTQTDLHQAADLFRQALSSEQASANWRHPACPKLLEGVFVMF